MHLVAVIVRVWTSNGRQWVEGAPRAQALFVSY